MAKGGTAEFEIQIEEVRKWLNESGEQQAKAKRKLDNDGKVVTKRVEPKIPPNGEPKKEKRVVKKHVRPGRKLLGALQRKEWVDHFNKNRATHQH